jgi:simple sugar transport system permease protein
MKDRIALQLVAPALALVSALALSSLLLELTGYSAGEVFSTIFSEGFDRIYLTDTVNRAGPYYIAGVAVAVGFKMNLFNIGVEGQYRIAALIAAWAGAAVTLPGPLHIVFILLVAGITGSIWALIPGILKATRGVSEVISSIMLNAIAAGVSSFLLQRWLRQPVGEGSSVVGTRPLAESAQMPTLNGPLRSIGIDIPDANRLYSYVFVALLVGVAYHVLVWRTRFGFDLRATGSNPEAAGASGVDPKRMVITAMAISGAFAGLIGLSRVLGEPAGRYTDVSVVGGLGFTGIAVALLGRNHPVGIAFGAFLWAFMDAVQTPLSNAQLPKEITATLQGITVLSVVIAYEVVRRITARREAAALQRDGDGATPPPASTATTEVAPA